MNGSAKRLMGASALVAVLALGGVQAVAAQAGGGGGGGAGGGGAARPPADPPIVAYRKAVMQTNAQHQAALRVLLAADSPIKSPEAVKMHAQALANSGKMMGETFPEGSTAPTSRAKEEIWTQKADFAAKMKDFADKAQALADAASKGENAATAAALTAMGTTCGGCHMPYRLQQAPAAAAAAAAPAAPAPAPN